MILTLPNYFSCQSLCCNVCLTNCPFYLPNFETSGPFLFIVYFYHGKMELTVKVWSDKQLEVIFPPVLSMKLQQFSSEVLSLFTRKQYSESYQLEISCNVTFVHFLMTDHLPENIGKIGLCFY